MRILAVDDDPIFRELLVEMLRMHGEDDVTSVGSGDEAIEALANSLTGYDCLLFDIQMPGLSGVELCRHVREMDDYLQTPIVMITSMKDRGYIDDAFAAGATDYVTKPLDATEFRARMGMVARLLSERRRGAALVHNAADDGMPEIAVDFEEPVMVHGLNGIIDFTAVQNYFATLGKKRLLTTAVFTCEISNAATIYTKAMPGDFVNIIGDVATVIFDTLKTHQVMISYAGSGRYICIVNALAGIDTMELEREINLAMMDFREIYSTDRLPMPRVIVGPMARSSLFSLANPTRIVDRALSDAEEARAAAGSVGYRASA